MRPRLTYLRGGEMTYLGGASREMEHTVKYNARSRRLGVGKSGLERGVNAGEQWSRERC